MSARADRFRAVFDANHRAVLAYALRRASPADAADVLADTMLVAWRRIDDVPPGEHARPWLYGVAHKVLANRRRGDERRERLGSKLAAFVTESFVAPSEATDDVLWVRAALDALDDIDREVLTLTTSEGLSPMEIAVALDIPATTVRTRLHRARLRLRAELEATDSERWPSSGHQQGDGIAIPDEEEVG